MGRRAALRQINDAIRQGLLFRLAIEQRRIKVCTVIMRDFQAGLHFQSD